MQKALRLLILLFALIPVFSFTTIGDKEGAMFVEDDIKAVILLNIKHLLNNKPAAQEIKIFEEGFFKNIQSYLSKEGYTLTIRNKAMNVKNELTAFDIAVDNKKTIFYAHMDIDRLIKNGQSTAIFIDKKKGEVISLEASQIMF